MTIICTTVTPLRAGSFVLALIKTSWINESLEKIAWNADAVKRLIITPRTTCARHKSRR